PPEDWLQSLRSLAKGETMPRGVARRILSEMAAQSAPPDLDLTEREREVVRLVAAAMTNKQVASALYISEQTVKNHIKSILKKLHLKNRVELALRAQRLAAKHDPPRNSPKES
ncbi:MAG: response regulator transcription factor, partial [Rubrobacteraceae bacterium]